MSGADLDSTWRRANPELAELESAWAALEKGELLEAGRDLQSAILGALLIVGAAAIAGAVATWRILGAVRGFFHGR